MRIALALFPFLIAWTLLGGGAGCSTPPSAVQIPFFCDGVTGTYHWASRGGESFAWTENGVRDTEWNGTNDGIGPECVTPVADLDESDPLDQHAAWQYLIEPDGSYFSDNWVLDCPEGIGPCQTWEWPRMFFPVTAGRTYALPVTFPIPSNPAKVNIKPVKCNGQAVTVDWYSFVNTETLTFVAPASGTCQLEIFMWCESTYPSLANNCPVRFRAMRLP